MDNECVWVKGQRCLAKWPGDGKWHPAKIIGFQEADLGKQALVSFDGYSSNDNELLPLYELRPKAKATAAQNAHRISDSTDDEESLFRPLCGDEEKKRLESEYFFADYDVGPPEVQRSKIKTKETDSIRSNDKKEQSIHNYREKSSPVNTASHSVKKDTPSKSPANNSSICSDIFDDDVEKPFFPHVRTDSEEPLILSKRHKVPSTINRYLRDYQREGVEFLYTHYSNHTGALLADDMGLGKTVQVIAFISALLEKTGQKEDVMKMKPMFIQELSGSPVTSASRKPFLVIGPASVLYNWIDEFETWGHFAIGKYHKHWKESTMKDLRKEKLDVVVTTYETCRDNLSDINSIEWAAIIADEAHRIKGVKADTTQNFKKLICKRRFGLTGTPLQNRLDEFWCVMDWVRPGCLGKLTQFDLDFIQPIEKGQKQDATKRQLAVARRAQNTLSQKKKEWMLRRTKSLIADQLPQKEESVIYCKPSPLQLDVYKAILSHDAMKVVLLQNHPCPCGSNKQRRKCCFKKAKDGRSIASVTLSYMHLLLKTANHVAMLLPQFTNNETQKKQALEICAVAFQKHPEFMDNANNATFCTLSDPKHCGKMRVLQGLLSVFRKQKSKVLLFSYSTKLLDILETYIMSKGHVYRRLDGSTPDVKRLDLVKEFNNDANIFLFLMSTKAGGVGLNLTGADVVIIFDPNWNPTHDLQAQDRAYRIGQNRNVRVYRLVTSGTIEENIYLRQIYKQQLETVTVASGNAVRYFQGVQSDRRDKGELFGVENMFKLRTGDRCLTEDIIKRRERIDDSLKGFQVEEYVPPCLQDSQDKDDDVNEDSYSSDEEIDDSSDFSSDEESPCLPKDARGRYKSSNKSSAPTPSSRKSTDVPLTQTFSSVTDVLDDCGVVHQHRNKEIVGSNKAEDHMTKCALTDVFENHVNSQDPAVHCAPMSDEEPPPAKKKMSIKEKKRIEESKAIIERTGPQSHIFEKQAVLVGQTPIGIRRQQFTQLAEHLGISVVELAKKVTAQSKESSIEMLKEFYTSQNEGLSFMFISNPQLKATPEKESPVKKPAPSRKRPRKLSYVSSDSDEDMKPVPRKIYSPEKIIEAQKTKSKEPSAMMKPLTSKIPSAAPEKVSDVQKDKQSCAIIPKTDELTKAASLSTSFDVLDEIFLDCDRQNYTAIKESPRKLKNDCNSIGERISDQLMAPTLESCVDEFSGPLWRKTQTSPRKTFSSAATCSVLDFPDTMTLTPDEEVDRNSRLKRLLP